MRDTRSHNDIKVGLSINPTNRQKQLYRTNTPLPYNLHTVWAVENHFMAEKIAHDVLIAHRINMKREWFEIVPVNSMNRFPGVEGCYDDTSVFLEALVWQIQDAFVLFGMGYEALDDLESLAHSISLKDIKFL